MLDSARLIAFNWDSVTPCRKNEYQCCGAELVVVAIPPAAQDAETKTVLDSVAAHINVEVQQQAEADFDALKLALSDSMCAG